MSAARFVRQAVVVAGKDLTLEMRARERLLAMLTFAILVAVVFSFALDPTIRARGLGGAMLWVTILFAGLLGLGRSFNLEKEQDAMTGVLLAPVDRGALYLGKLAANLVLLLIADVVVFAVYALFFQLGSGATPIGLAVIALLGSVGFIALGTLFGAVTANTRLGDTLLPVLVLPLLIPVVIFAAGATQHLLMGRPMAEVSGSIRMLAAFDIIFLVVCTLIFESVVEE